MIEITRYATSIRPDVSLICALSPDRQYLWDRAMAEMQVELAGLAWEYVVANLDGEEWNECKGKNCAAEHSCSDRLIFTNCDIVIPRKVVEELLRTWRDDVLTLCDRIDEGPDNSQSLNEDAIGDFQAISKPLWDKVRYDERMTGWGYLDYDFAERCGKAGAAVERIGTGFIKHFWHPRLSDAEYRKMNERNRRIACAS